MSQISNERVLRVADKSGNEYYITDPNVPALVKKLNEQMAINNALSSIVGVTGNNNLIISDSRDHREFSEIKAVTLSTGHVKVFYGWDSGGDMLYTLKAPGKVAVNDPLYDLTSSNVASIEESTLSTFDSVVATCKADEVFSLGI